MGNLGLEDAEEAEDQSMRMPEDVASSSAPRTQKRKIEEVADSEDEDEIELGSAAKLPPMPKVGGGFLPSSQLTQSNGEDAGSRLRAREAASGRLHAAAARDEDEDEMLLRN